MDKSSSEQQFRKWEGIIFAVLNFWSHTPSGTRSYGRPAVRQAGRLAGRQTKSTLFSNFLKFTIDRNNRHFALLNKCKALL